MARLPKPRPLARRKAAPPQASRPRRRPDTDKPRGTSLTPERIVAAALALVERVGLRDFSLRRLGVELGCEAMSLYHHFPSKAHLLDALVDHAIAEVETDPPGIDPIERLRAVAYSYRAMAHRHPKLYPLLAVHRLNTPTGVGVIDRILALCRDAVGDDRLAAQYFRVFGYYLTGAALEETSGYAKGPSAAEPASDDYVAAHCPHLAAAAPYFKSPLWDGTFALGLRSLSAAMPAAARAEEPGATATPLPKPVIRPKR